ncbi:MAG TPA: M1 family aminopeptidase [Polyangia bacterium]|jgi:puromycin-sensitive aminopeptidase
MGDKNFRLPEDVRPSRYRARLAVDLPRQRFDGHLVIELDLVQPRRELTLHGVDLEVTRAVLRAGQVVAEARAAADADSETITFALDREAPAGPAALEIDYHAGFSGGLRGLYLAGPVAVTQFEAADARRVFPCFDEPAFKARWALEVEIAADLAALSNGAVVREAALPGGRREVAFAETPPLSSYLVAIIVGKLASTPPLMVRGVPVRTLATPEKIDLCAFGQACIGATLPLLMSYFDVPYPFGKLDQIGIPDFEAGAMENAGAITFREVALLCDPERAPIGVQKRIAEVITHEAAHQWFGNLVTMVWWDDLWLNEAFATWMAYKIVAEWRPAWRIWLDFERSKAGALGMDALVSTHPIHTEVLNAAQAGENFDAITYEKGGAVLRMIEGYLGEATFRDGIRRYVRRHAFANAAADDLWRALAEASAQPIDELAASWIKQPGFPLLEARVDGRRLRLGQRRFFADPGRLAQGDPQRWVVPVVLRYGDEAGAHEERVLLRDGAELDLPGQGRVTWLCANAGARGFWRVAYDAATLAGLAEHRAELDTLERMNLVADQWALMRVGVVGVDAVLDLFARFGGETDHAVLEEVGARLGAVEDRLCPAADRPLVGRFIEGLLGAQLDELGWEPAPGEDDQTRLRRAALISALGLVARSRRVVDAAIARFNGYLAEPASVDPNLHDAVVLMAARHGDARGFDQILARLAVEHDPAARRRFLLSLGSFEAPELTERAVRLFLSETVPLQEMAFYLARLLDNRATREPAWALLRTRWDEVAARAASPQILRRFVRTLAVLPERRHIAEVEQFLAAHPIEGSEQARAQTLERLKLEVDLRERITPRVSAWLHAHVAI